jgi:uncharacterized protein YqkB
MELTFTEAALERIGKKIDGKKVFLKLKHDTEGCGCVVSGVSALWVVDETLENDTKVITNGPDVYMEYNTEVFFDGTMVIDVAAGNHFILKSPGETLNPSLKLYDKTGENTGR